MKYMINPPFTSIAYASGVIEDAPSLATVLLNVLEWFLQMVGSIAVIAFVVLGIFFLISRGNEKMVELAKRGMMAAVIGLVAILGAFVVLSTIGNLFAI